MEASDAPEDRGKLVYGSLCLLGVATLLPWNVFITENEFFDIRVHQPPTYHAIADNFETAIVLMFQFVNFFALVVLIPLQRYIPLHQQVMLPLGLTFAVLVLAAIIAASTSASGAAVILTMLPSIGLMGLTTALLQGGLFGLAGLCPPIYVQATSVGQAVAGFGVSVLSFVTLWAVPGVQPGEIRTPEDVAWSAFTYFCVSAVVIAASMVGYWMLQHSPFWHHYTVTYQDTEDEKVEQDFLEGLGADAGQIGSITSSQARDMDNLPLLRHGGRVAFHSTTSKTGHMHTSGQPEQLARVGGERVVAPLGELLWALRWHSLVLGLCFALTIAVFPSVTASICSVKNPAVRPPCFPHVASGRLAGDLWTPLLFLLFNAGDLGGRLLAGIGSQHRPLPVGVLLSYAMARVLLMVGLLLCRVVTPHPWRMPFVFRSDVFPILLTSLLGLTNGHLASLTSMHMPSLLPSAYRVQSGPVIAFSITFGLTLGSILALALVSALQS